MFAIDPYTATHHAVHLSGGQTIETWQLCRVVGIDATGADPKYLVEIRGSDGSFYIDRADLIRKPAPTAAG
ncbi:hypothetical protein [Aquibium sp. ELW1220]|uniref:hypothetical protein n=1 Tax=Aquibium sp. ELW1220 TaxID=2976766 RepID=UPI0025B0AC2C|nr:hypothetical protein [Aquibium sp. ELW1220]MDN2582366.1 hypothetical protein [Aquibium sp. ELW1220]